MNDRFFISSIRVETIDVTGPTDRWRRIVPGRTLVSGRGMGGSIEIEWPSEWGKPAAGDVLDVTVLLESES